MPFSSLLVWFFLHLPFHRALTPWPTILATFLLRASILLSGKNTILNGVFSSKFKTCITKPYWRKLWNSGHAPLEINVHQPQMGLPSYSLILWTPPHLSLSLHSVGNIAPTSHRKWKPYNPPTFTSICSFSFILVPSFQFQEISLHYLRLTLCLSFYHLLPF